MKLFNFTIVKLLICLVLGILLGFWFPLSLNTSAYVSCCLFILFGLSFFILKTKTNNTHWFGFLGFLTMVSLGVLNTSLHDDLQFKNHHTYTSTLNDTINNTITFRIREVLKPSNFHDKYVIDILKVDAENVFGKSLLNINKDSSSLLKADDIFMTRTQFAELYSPLNPEQFDYKN